jgi:hypothetical protein
MHNENYFKSLRKAFACVSGGLSHGNLFSSKNKVKPANYQISLAYKRVEIDDALGEAESLKEDKEDFFLLKCTPDQKRNINVIIRAFTSVRLEKVKLIVVANNEGEVAELEQQRISKNITVLVCKDLKLLNYLYSKAWGFINCSITEISKLTVVRAKESSCALVLSDIKSFRMLARSAIFFDPGSVASVVAAILSALKE